MLPVALEQLSRPAWPIVHGQQQRTECLCRQRDEGHGRGRRGQRHDMALANRCGDAGVQSRERQAVPLAEVVAGCGPRGRVSIRGNPEH